MINYANKRVGSLHEEVIRKSGRSYCNQCGYIDDVDPSYVDVIEWHGDSFNEGNNIMIQCSICHNECDVVQAHIHQGKYIGDECCWDERLRTTE